MSLSDCLPAMCAAANAKMIVSAEVLKNRITLNLVRVPRLQIGILRWGEIIECSQHRKDLSAISAAGSSKAPKDSGYIGRGFILHLLADGSRASRSEAAAAKHTPEPKTTDGSTLRRRSRTEWGEGFKVLSLLVLPY